MPDNVKEKLRDLPSVDQLLRSDAGRAVSELAGPRHASRLAATIIGTMRSEFAGLADHSREALLSEAANRLLAAHKAAASAATTRVINATGVIIHTNLGRAPLSTDARNAVADAAQYCTLEYDTLTGQRGKRGRYVEDLLCELTGAKSALIVNNCAAAAFFVLTVFAANGEVVISRGELVEIGGDFRIPDVLTNSAATLREVGTTNRTKIAGVAVKPTIR